MPSSRTKRSIIRKLNEEKGIVKSNPYKNFDASKHTDEEIIKIANRLSQRVNRRLRQIENANLKDASNAYKYLERLKFDNSRIFTRSKDTLRIREKLTVNSKNLATARRIITEASFYLYESSTGNVKDIENKYRKAYETAKEGPLKVLFENMSFEEYADFVSSSGFSEFLKMYGSSELVRVKEAARKGTLSDEQLKSIIRNMVEYMKAHEGLTTSGKGNVAMSDIEQLVTRIATTNDDVSKRLVHSQNWNRLRNPEVLEELNKLK